MKDLNKYHVKEIPPARATASSIPDYQKSPDSDWNIGCAAWIATVVISYIFLASLDDVAWWVWLLPILLAFGVSNGIKENRRDNRMGGLIASQNRENHEASRREARNTTDKARNQIIYCYEELEKLKKIYSEIDDMIKQAEQEYHENAFSPYWDKIEIAIAHFDEYIKNVDYIPYGRNAYNKILDGREHNFPKFPITNKMIPDIRVHLNEFKRVVRLGQTNYEFASIFEDRKTREVLIAGFKNLAEALSNIESKVENAVTEFNQLMTKKLVD